MPEVNGKSYSYDKKGMADAKRAKANAEAKVAFKKTEAVSYDKNATREQYNDLFRRRAAAKKADAKRAKANAEAKVAFKKTEAVSYDKNATREQYNDLFRRRAAAKKAALKAALNEKKGMK